MAGGEGPIIVSALLGNADFAWANGLRRAHFPPERNIIDAHLTLFHHLPPSIGPELRDRLVAETRGVAPPVARVAGLMNLGCGVAFRVESTGLEAVRERLAEAFRTLLTPQDRAGFRPHITIQNKVEPAEARALLSSLSAAFIPRPLWISGLATWRYAGGPWEPLSRHMFSPAGRSRCS